MYDIAIIGLGPAGATLARLLNPEFKVIAIDKKDMSGNGGFKKPCGGLLATDAQKLLSRFGLALPKEILVDPQIFAVKTIDTKQDISRYYQRFYINMDRHRFDLWLMGLIPSNVEIKDKSSCTAIHKKDGAYEIEYKRDGETHLVKAKYIVGADGANSIVRRRLSGEIKTRKYISIQQWFVDKNVRPLYSCFFDSGITDCYGWSISKDGFFIVGGAFPLKRGQKAFNELKRKLEDKGYSLGEAVKTEACLVLRPTGFLSFLTGKDNAFLTGEAAGFISPSSLEGISYAFDSAMALAEVFNSRVSRPNLVYARRMLKTRARLTAKALKSPFMYAPLLRRLIMKSGLSSIDVINEKRRDKHA